MMCFEILSALWIPGEGDALVFLRRHQQSVSLNTLYISQVCFSDAAALSLHFVGCDWTGSAYIHYPWACGGMRPLTCGCCPVDRRAGLAAPWGVGSVLEEQRDAGHMASGASFCQGSLSIHGRAVYLIKASSCKGKALCGVYKRRVKSEVKEDDVIQNVQGLEEPMGAWRVIFSRIFCPCVMVLVLRVKKAASVMMLWQHDVLYFWLLSRQFYCFTYSYWQFDFALSSTCARISSAFISPNKTVLTLQTCQVSEAGKTSIDYYLKYPHLLRVCCLNKIYSVLL